jgi:hypothetical protein
MKEPVVVALTEPLTVTVVVAPELVTAVAPGSTKPVSSMLQRNTLRLASPFKVIIGDEVAVVVVPVLVPVCVTMSVAGRLVLPAASVAVNKSMLVLELLSRTGRDQLPPALAVVEAALAPPVTETVELASAIPVTVMGEVVVE